jgi:hypothetical protein
MFSLPREENFGPMIADQEKINGCVRFAFQLSPFLNLAVKSTHLFLCSVFQMNFQGNIFFTQNWCNITLI